MAGMGVRLGHAYLQSNKSPERQTNGAQKSETKYTLASCLLSFLVLIYDLTSNKPALTQSFNFIKHLHTQFHIYIKVLRDSPTMYVLVKLKISKSL